MNELEQLGEKQISSTNIFDGNILHVKKDIVILPNGKEASREVIRHIGAVCVVPITDDGKIIVERQFRYPLNRVITEIPAGKLDSKDEDRLEAAKRELREETGYSADNWTDLGKYHPTAAYCDEVISMFMASGLHLGNRDLDEDEFLNVSAVPIETLLDEIMDGTITDGKTLAAILKVARILGK